MRFSSLIRVFVITSMATAACALPITAQQVDVIRGQVVGPDGKPLEDAKVTATSLSGNVNRSARTDRNGRYTITFPGGEGDYFVEIAAIGYAARRFEVSVRPIRRSWLPTRGCYLPPASSTPSGSSDSAIDPNATTQHPTSVAASGPSTTARFPPLNKATSQRWQRPSLA